MKKTTFYFLTVWILFVTFVHKTNAQECGTPTTGNNQNFSYLNKDGNDETSICINVFFHIVRQSNGSEGFNFSNIELIVEDLNEYYNPHDIFIHKLGVDYINNSTYYDLSSDEFDGLVKLNNVSNAINFYLVNSAPYAGRAESILSKNLVTVNSYALSPTSAHELGHCLNLWHTHHGLGCSDTGGCSEAINGSNCSSCGDFVCDTPADPCVFGQVNTACGYTGGGGYNPDPTNIMSYGSYCRDHFTFGQGDRMIASIEGSSLLQQIISNTCSIPKLSGSDCICSSNTTYTLQNGGTNVTWEVSSNLQTVSSSNTVITVRAFNENNGSTGYVRAVLPNQTLTENIWVGKPSNQDIDFGVYFTSPNDKVPLYENIHIGILSNSNADKQCVTGYHWDFGSWESYVTGYSTQSKYSKYTANIYLTSNAATQQPVEVSAVNPCGYNMFNSAGKFFYVDNNYYYFSVFPNPSSNKVTVQKRSDKDGHEGLSVDKGENSLTTINLYDFNGNLMLSKPLEKEKTTVDVSKLHKGRYILKISPKQRSKNDKEETHHLIID